MSRAGSGLAADFRKQEEQGMDTPETLAHIAAAQKEISRCFPPRVPSDPPKQPLGGLGGGIAEQVDLARSQQEEEDRQELAGLVATKHRHEILLAQHEELRAKRDELKTELVAARARIESLEKALRAEEASSTWHEQRRQALLSELREWKGSHDWIRQKYNDLLTKPKKQEKKPMRTKRVKIKIDGNGSDAEVIVSRIDENARRIASKDRSWHLFEVPESIDLSGFTWKPAKDRSERRWFRLPRLRRPRLMTLLVLAAVILPPDMVHVALSALRGAVTAALGHLPW